MKDDHHSRCPLLRAGLSAAPVSETSYSLPTLSLVASITWQVPVFTVGNPELSAFASGFFFDRDRALNDATHVKISGSKQVSMHQSSETHPAVRTRFYEVTFIAMQS